MKKYIKWGLLLVVVLIIMSTARINITFNANTANADTSMGSTTIADADKHLDAAINNTFSPGNATRDAQIANAIYSKKIYELLKDNAK